MDVFLSSITDSYNSIYIIISVLSVQYHTCTKIGYGTYSIIIKYSGSTSTILLFHNVGRYLIQRTSKFGKTPSLRLATFGFVEIMRDEISHQ